MEFVSAPVRRQKGPLAIADAREGLRQVGELLGDEMDDFPFPLNGPSTPSMQAERMMRRCFS